MGYKSPIDIMRGKMQMDLENGIFKAVEKVGINVDKEELIKALHYDRNQYDKGYADGKKETAQTALEEFICKLVNLRLVGVNDDMYYEMLEIKDSLLKERFGIEIKE